MQGNAQKKMVNIRWQLHKLILTVSIPMVVIIAVLLVMLVSVNHQYHSVLQNANNAADFNQEFKQTIDSKMYNHVIQPRTGHDVADLPMADLDDAVAVLQRLDATTTLRDNRWRIRSMLNMCENLRAYMIEIAENPQYDERMELLERNIRGETGLTVLIETYMNNYINDEVRELVRLERSIAQQTRAIILCTVIVVAVILISMLIYSLAIARRINKPISALALKVEAMGEGEWSPAPLATGITELQTLSAGFDAMAQRIQSLMEKQIADEKALHRTELELLQAQINPHFLYNTLDSIAILAELDRKEDVVSMVTSLSTFFRNSLSKGKEIISLQTEAEQVSAYLEIQKVRYSDILDYSVDIPMALRDCLVPKLILQPLVENALYHGIKNKRTRGTIVIRCDDLGPEMEIHVSDSGSGMTAEQLNALQNLVSEAYHNGHGLVNVQKRIKLYCGEAYGLTFESQEGEGTCVTVHLPKRLPAETEALA